MRLRTVAVASLLAALAAGFAVPAALGRAREHREGAAAGWWAGVRVAGCDLDARTGVFQGRMRRVPGSVRMGMRFAVLERLRGDRFRPVEAPGLGRWRKSKPGKALFDYRQRVRGLVAGAAYRALVHFRWYGEDGQPVRRTRRRSGVCDLGGPLPNLRVAVLGAERTDVPGVLRYTVRVVNRGGVSASNFGVRLAVDRGEVNTITVASLAPRGRALLAFRARSCERIVEAVVDPADAVREAVEEDNRHSVACADLAA